METKDIMFLKIEPWLLQVIEKTIGKVPELEPEDVIVACIMLGVPEVEAMNRDDLIELINMRKTEKR